MTFNENLNLVVIQIDQIKRIKRQSLRQQDNQSIKAF